MINLNWNLRGIKDLSEAPLHLLNGLQNELFIKADVKGSTPNDLMTSWNLVIKHDLTYDYVRNKFVFFLTRIAPGERDLKVGVPFFPFCCIFNYPQILLRTHLIFLDGFGNRKGVSRNIG